MRALADAIATFVATKRAMCRIEGGPHDLAGMVDVLYVDGERQLTILTGHPLDQAAACIRTLRERGEVAEVVVLSECVFASLPIDADPQRGEIVDMHYSDPTAPTREALVAHAVTSAGERMVVTVMYGYDDSGQPVFERPLYSPNATGGLIDVAAEAMR